MVGPVSDDAHAEMDALQGRVFALAERGATVEEIAAEVGRQQRTVKRWLADPALQQRWGVECVLRRGRLRLVAPVEDADEGEGARDGDGEGEAVAVAAAPAPPLAPAHTPARDTHTPARAPDPPRLADLSDAEAQVRAFIEALRDCGMLELAAHSVGMTLDEVRRLVDTEAGVRAVRRARAHAPMQVMRDVRDSLAAADGMSAKAGLEVVKAMWPALFDAPEGDLFDAPGEESQAAVETLLQAVLDTGGIEANAGADLMAGAKAHKESDAG